MLCLDDGTDHTVGLIDISAGGVAVAVSADSPLSVANGDKVTVKFESDRLGTPLQISSHIRRIKFSSDKKSIMYGVLFDTWTDKRLNLTPKLRSLFNEREAVRVEPREDEEIDVHLVVNGEERIVRGLLRDISVSGVGVWLNDDEDSKACTDPQISVDLTLPDDASTSGWPLRFATFKRSAIALESECGSLKIIPRLSGHSTSTSPIM